MDENGEQPKPQGGDAFEYLLQMGFATWAYNRMTIGIDDTGSKATGYTVIPVTMVTHWLLKEVVGHLLETSLPIRNQMSARSFTTY